MCKIVEKGERVTTIILDGTECAVKFQRTFTEFIVQNIGETDIFVAAKSGKFAYDDGVITLHKNEQDTFYRNMWVDTCYIFGVKGGVAQIRGMVYSDCDCCYML